MTLRLMSRLMGVPACAMQRDMFTAVLHLLSGSPQGAGAMTSTGTGSTMADEGEDGGQRTPHHGTYESFMAATKWGVILIALALILMALFLV